MNQIKAYFCHSIFSNFDQCLLVGQLRRRQNCRILKNWMASKHHDCQGEVMLKQRQYKNDFIQSKIIPILKLTQYFTTYNVKEKERQIQNWNHFRLNGIVLIMSMLYSKSNLCLPSFAKSN